MLYQITLTAVVHRDGKVWQQEYEKGKTLYPVKEVGKTDKTGTIVTFKPDLSIFKDVEKYSYDTLANRMRELAFLNKGIKISLTDKRKKVEGDFLNEEFHSQEGLKEFIKFLDENQRTYSYLKLSLLKEKKIIYLLKLQ